MINCLHSNQARLLIALNFYSQILSHGLVPESFTSGVIIPVLNKPTLNPSISGNYRPITLSTTHAKLIELLMLPKVNLVSVIIEVGLLHSQPPYLM